ncbi:transposase [endosymbiont of Lamellibrachia barhami]|uniref:transposase n=1 Tax=endosymbiont of Lamellibrachia barhami TaxID=205975 RepID=UPI0015ACB053|nr:transposase [endosymbiont of Lamellibrachia barhami]
MVRLLRIGPLGIPQHIIQRGNNRQVCFANEQDMAFYASLLEGYSKEFSVTTHAWIFMTNHVHLLATPHAEEGISKMMQALGRRYVRYFNREYRRSGTLWEGRFKSSLVQSENYLLQCQRYIELNPVRACMTNDPAEYHWSSYQSNALGKKIALWTPHEEYLRLGETGDERQRAYRALFSAHVDNELLNDIRSAVNKGLALGGERFKLEIEQLYGRRVKPAKMGRPKKGKPKPFGSGFA